MPLSIQYVKGLFQSRKGNIERMVEHVADSEYYSMQHFISESPWDARTGFDTVALDTNEVFKSFDQVALLIDESSDLKKGDYSVGVSRQYCGTIGKVDNCQVAVYGGLSAEHYYGLIDTALYLPESWTANRKRCKAAGVPKERYKHKTKVELAVDIVRYQLELGTHFDFPPGWEETNLPTLTFLKRNGFSFDRAFCNTCMCSPSRTTLFTGIYPAKHKVSQTLTIGGPLSPSEPTISASLPSIMNVLWNDGYDVQYRGKWHMSKGVAGNGATTNYDNLTSADISLFGAMGWIAPDAGEDVNPLNFGGGFANHDARYVAEAIKYLQEVKVKRAAGELNLIA
ncbi:transposase [Chitinophaga sp. LS1]|uniref:transposase n=1 Tax=Chitinophaga sp. LS1 TaxID=3051176 RepID=UPI002AABDCD8|nr:transposase [Chitinophaga sp. LS1]WPV66354.1 transposase [Chitinophaga sp. LS1]